MELDFFHRVTSGPVVTVPIGKFSKASYGNKSDKRDPKHIAWQWAVKDSPDIQRCSKATLKSKQCPERRFLPRLRKSLVPKDIFSCEEPKIPKKKKQTWKEYFSFLLPEEITQKPPLTMCRKLLQIRRQKCMQEHDWMRCIGGPCGPPPEWYGQAVIKGTYFNLPEPVDDPLPRFCPPPEHTIPRCAIAKLPVCPVKPKSLPCLQDYDYKIPFSDFKGGQDGDTKGYIVKCNYKCISCDLPLINDKSAKLTCKNYGEFKGVECPKTMFTRFMSVDLPGGTLRPVAVSDHTPQREIKKGICERTTLTEPRSIRNYHTSAVRHSAKKSNETALFADYDTSFQSYDHTCFLQPNYCVVPVEKIVKRAGFHLKRNPLTVSKPSNAPRRNIIAENLATKKSNTNKDLDNDSVLANTIYPKKAGSTPPQIEMKNDGETVKDKNEQSDVSLSETKIDPPVGKPNHLGFLDNGENKLLPIELKSKEGKPVTKNFSIHNIISKELIESLNTSNSSSKLKLKPSTFSISQQCNQKSSRNKSDKNIPTKHQDTKKRNGPIARYHGEIRRQQKMVNQTRKFHSSSWTKKHDDAECEEKEKEKVKIEKKPAVEEAAKKKVVEEKQCPPKRVDPYKVKRESCYPRIPKKNNKGILCSIAYLFGFGCGKKKGKC